MSRPRHVAQEALYAQVTLDLLAAREELARLDPGRRDEEPDAINPVVLFGRPIELERNGEHGTAEEQGTGPALPGPVGCT
ncbi:hypothetical protein D1007_51811 [Hordeum vulgare]|nr:hypothetical protein D1007_51811 [Hordeum vulgare]